MPIALSSRFKRPIFLWALAALITQLAVQSVDSHLRWLMLLPLVPVAFFLAALVRTIRKMDELQQRITLESLAIAFMLTLAVAFALAGLQSAGVRDPWVRDQLGTFMLLFWSCAYVFSVRRYR